MSKILSRCRILSAGLAATSLTLFSLGLAPSEAHAQAGIFEVIHPDVERGQTEIEILSGIAFGSVEDGEERSVHEIALGYGVTDYWKATVAIEIANPEGGSAEVEAFEFEHLLLLSKGGHGHDEKDDNAEEDHHGFTFGLYAALEAPLEGGISEGGLEIGPVFETELGEAEFIGNLLVEIPFADEEDAGLAYATQLVLPVSDGFGIGVENFGTFEGLFGERGDDLHFAGPALYWETELSNGHVIEPRIAVLFGLNDETPDTTLSFNIEYKIGPK